MKCTNCNAPVPDGADICPECGTEIDRSVLRCPECFVKLEKGTKSCPKCGCNIKKALLTERLESEKEDETFFTRFLKMSLKTKIISLLTIVFVAAGAILGLSFYRSVKTEAYCKNAREYAVQMQKSMKTITDLAEEYDKIYKGEWLVQTENASALEKKYADEISELKDSRDNLNFLMNELLRTAADKKTAGLVEKVYSDYDKCYLYVVEKAGKTNGYMAGYYKLYDKYRNSLKNFKADANQKIRR